MWLRGRRVIGVAQGMAGNLKLLLDLRVQIRSSEFSGHPDGVFDRQTIR